MASSEGETVWAGVAGSNFFSQHLVHQCLWLWFVILLSAFPAFLDTELNSGFETWHSHLFVSNWLFLLGSQELLSTDFCSYSSRVWSTAEWLCQICWWLLWKLACVLRLYKLALGHKVMLLCSPLLFFSACLWSASSSLALTFEDMMVLKSRGLGIYWAHDQIINNLKSVAPLRFVSWHVHNSTHRYLSVPWTQNGL